MLAFIIYCYYSARYLCVDNYLLLRWITHWPLNLSTYYIFLIIYACYYFIFWNLSSDHIFHFVWPMFFSASHSLAVCIDSMHSDVSLLQICVKSFQFSWLMSIVASKKLAATNELCNENQTNHWLFQFRTPFGVHCSHSVKSNYGIEFIELSNACFTFHTESAKWILVCRSVG